MFGNDDFRSRFFDEFFRSMNPMFAPRVGVYPQVNIYDDGESFMVRAEVSGLEKDSIDLSARKDQLTIRGARSVKPADEKASYHRRERDAGQFRRTITLPQAIDAEKVSATYKNGILEVVLPRAPESKQRKIQVS
jgi:HSP20 family protein